MTSNAEWPPARRAAGVTIIAKNQLMNQVALAMLTQANNAQKGLLDLVAG